MMFLDGMTANMVLVIITLAILINFTLAILYFRFAVWFKQDLSINIIRQTSKSSTYAKSQLNSLNSTEANILPSSSTGVNVARSIYS